MKNVTPLYHTVITTGRHREHGYCEESDFGKIELYQIPAEEKNLIVTFKRYDNEPFIEYVEHNGRVFKKVNKDSYLRMSREEHAEWLKKQGRFSDKSAVKLMVEIRERSENSFSHAPSLTFLLIGSTLYQSYGKLEDFGITQTGNLLFSCWWSIDFEIHGNKDTSPFSEASFKKVLAEARKKFNQAKPKEGRTRGDGHVYLGYPKQITWGEKYKAN